MPPVHAAAVLAAGGSRRLGRSKQLLLVDSETLVHRAVRLALSTRPWPVLVITGHADHEIRSAADGLPVEFRHCRDWRQGMGTSLRTAVQALPGGCDGLLVVLCDQPGLDSAHLEGLLDLWRRAPDRAAASAYAGVIGVPAVLPRRWFGQLATLDADVGARQLMRRAAEHIATLDAPQLAHDIDRPEDL